jgi:hypothetical protein
MAGVIDGEQHAGLRPAEHGTRRLAQVGAGEAAGGRRV